MKSAVWGHYKIILLPTLGMNLPEASENSYNGSLCLALPRLDAAGGSTHKESLCVIMKSYF